MQVKGYSRNVLAINTILSSSAFFSVLALIFWIIMGEVVSIPPSGSK